MRRLSAPFGALALFVSCNAVLGISDDPVVRSSATSCVHHSDCATNQICLFRLCSPPCQQDRDCEEGKRCLQSEAGTACVSNAAAACDSAGDCPAGTVCEADTCRNQCSTSAECLDDQECASDGVCRGKDPDRDPPPGAGGNGSGGEGPDAAGSGGQGGGGGSAGQPDLPQLGDGCEDDGAIACPAHASAERLICDGGEYVVHDACGEGELCDTAEETAGSCAPVAPECQGREPLEAFCDGAVRTVCGPDLVTVEKTTCASVQACTYGNGPDCAVCLPNEYHCAGDVLQLCNDAHTAFEDLQTCTDAPCNADAGACTENACATPGMRKCDGNDLVECADDLMSFEVVDTCEICDPNVPECDVCSPGDKSCSGDSVVECSTDGQTEDTSPCPENTPHCVGNGACVECTTASDCPAVDDCHTKFCNTGSGACEPIFKGTGATCSAGVCNAEEQCVECYDTEDHCDEGTEICRAGTCEDAVADHGWTGVLPTDTTLLANWLYVFQLPPLEHNAVIERFVVYGKSGTSGYYAMALYEGDATRPNGAPIAQMTDAQTWPTGALSVNVDQQAALTTTKTYWLAIMANAAVTIGTQASSGKGMRYSGQTVPTFPSISSTGASQNSVDWNMYIGIRYTE